MVAHSFSDPFFGVAQRLHGATYTVEVEVRASALGVHNVVMDLGALQEIVHRVLAGIDYSNLDDHPAFPGNGLKSSCQIHAPARDLEQYHKAGGS